MSTSAGMLKAALWQPVSCISCSITSPKEQAAILLPVIPTVSNIDHPFSQVKTTKSPRSQSVLM